MQNWYSISGWYRLPSQDDSLITVYLSLFKQFVFASCWDSLVLELVWFSYLSCLDFIHNFVMKFKNDQHYHIKVVWFSFLTFLSCLVSMHFSYVHVRKNQMHAWIMDCLMPILNCYIILLRGLHFNQIRTTVILADISYTYGHILNVSYESNSIYCIY